MITEPQLAALQPGDTVHRSTWEPHACVEFSIVSSREVDGRTFVFATRGARLADNQVITPVNSSGYHLAEQCPRANRVASERANL